MSTTPHTQKSRISVYAGLSWITVRISNPDIQAGSAGLETRNVAEVDQLITDLIAARRQLWPWPPLEVQR